jgi:hypothetical protein
MRIRATVVKALAAGALLVGVVGVAGAETAGALSINNFYVAKNGNNLNNSCTNKSAPCQTIAAAVAQADHVDSSGPNTINVAKGAYTLGSGDLNLTGQENLTIIGQVAKSGKNKVTLTGPNPIVSTDGTDTNVTVSNFNLLGTGGGSAGVALTAGNTLANSTYGASSPATVAISAQTGGTVSHDTVSGTLCTDVTKSGVAASSPAGTLVTLSKKVPACAVTSSSASATVTVGNTPTTVTIDTAQDGKKNLELTSAGPTPNDAIPAGATLSFNSSVAAYSGEGVVVGGTAVVENSTVDGSGGPTIGIATAEGATVTGNTVNGNGEAGIEATVPSSGTITIVGAASGDGNSGGSNEIGILIEGGGASGTISAVDNSVGGIEFGAELNGLNQNVTFTGNTVSESAEEGIGLALLNVGLSGTHSVSGNTINGTIGALLADGTINTNFTGNTVSGLLTGLAVPGAADPTDVTALLGAFSITPGTNTGNTITSNTVSGSDGANVLDLSAFDGEVAPACTTGDVKTASAIAPDTAITSISVKSTVTCTLNPGTTLVSTLDQELYVTSAATIIGGATSPTTVSVSNFIPLASSQLNNGLGSGSTLEIDSESDSSVANTYTTNSCTPDFNGSATLDAATGSAGYYSC